MMTANLLLAYLIGVPVWFLVVVGWCALMLRYDNRLDFALADCQAIILKFGCAGSFLWPFVAPVSASILFLMWWSFYCAEAKSKDAGISKEVSNGRS